MIQTQNIDHNQGIVRVYFSKKRMCKVISCFSSGTACPPNYRINKLVRNMDKERIMLWKLEIGFLPDQGGIQEQTPQRHVMLQ